MDRKSNVRLIPYTARELEEMVERDAREAKRAKREAKMASQIMAAMKRHRVERVGELPERVLEKILGPEWKSVLEIEIPKAP